VKIMGTKLSPGRTDCYAAALPDEPMFVMLARDASPPRLIRLWANDRENGIHAGQYPESDREMIAEALQCADDMDRWRDANLNVSIQTPDGVWVGKRWHYEQPPESPEEWIAAFRGHIELQRQALARMEAENAELRGAMVQKDQYIERQDARIEALESQDTVSRHTIERLERRVSAETISRLCSAGNRLIEEGITDRSVTLWDNARIDLDPMYQRHDPLPADLAEPPEINDHRFGHLEKHGDWAYARGLTVSPKHLPKALHQMEHDFGWRLLAIFGATDTQSIGFIFKRADATKVHLDIGANVDRAILEALTSKTATVAQILAESRTYRYDPDRGGKLDRLTESLSELHPDTAALVLDFTLSIAGRLRYVQERHNLTDNWLRDDWEVDCVDRLYRNLRNCDYVDAAALLAFAWKREFTTIPQGGRIRHMKPGAELRMSGVDPDDWASTRYRSGGVLTPSDRPFRAVDLAGEIVRPISRRSTGIMPAVALDQRGYIDPERELYAIRLRELAGFISPEEALDERITVLRATLDTLTKETGCAGLGRQQEP
jgi:hypothetical protein